MANDAPYSTGIFETIVDCHFGQEVIVVFAYHNVGFTFNSDADKAKALTVFSLSDGGLASSYRVDRDAGQFISITSGGSGDSAANQVGTPLYALVFAMVDDPSGVTSSEAFSLARAEKGTKLAVPYFDFENSLDRPGSPTPPGLLWSVCLRHYPPGFTSTWKARYGAHLRDPNAGNNEIAQCYPNIKTYSMGVNVGVTYSGYSIFVYRTDDKGLGTAYGVAETYNFIGPPSAQTMDPIWFQQISSSGNNDADNYGIRFSDPPPLITSDRRFRGSNNGSG